MTNRFDQEPQPDRQRRDEEAYRLKDDVDQDFTNGSNLKSQSHKQLPFVLNAATVQSPSASDNRHTIDKFRTRLWQRLSLRTKSSAMVIALSTLPILAIGTTAYYLTNKNLTESVTQQQQALVISLASQLDGFILEGYEDIQTLSRLNILNNREVRAVTSKRERQAVLNQYIKDTQVYDSIVVTDLSGNVILQSAGKVIPNYSQIDYFQEVIRTNRPVIAPPTKSLGTGEYSIVFAAPVVDTRTGKTIGMVRSRTPVRYFNKVLQPEANKLAQNIVGLRAEEYLAINDVGKVIGAPTDHAEYIGKDAQSIFPKAAEQLKAADAIGSVVDIDQLEQKEYLVSYAPLGEISGLPELNWSTMVAQPTAEIFAARRGLLLTFAIGTGVTVLLVAAIAAILTNRALRPLVEASRAVRKLSQGQLDTRIAVEGEDELAVLGSNINLMADQLQTQLRIQEAEAERTQLFTDIILRIRRYLNLEDILKTAVKEVRKVLKTDRVVIYRFDPDWNGTVVAESVTPGWTQALGEQINDPCFREGYAEMYKNGRVRAIDNIYQADLKDCHISTLERLEVKAKLVAPILKDNHLLGLLIAHHCSEPHTWQQTEIDLFAQLAIQIGITIEQANLLKELQQAEAVLRLRDRAIAATSNGIVISDPSLTDNPIIFCNPAFESMTGYPPSEVLGRNCRFLQGADTDPATIDKIRRAVREQVECQVVIKNYRKDGTMFWNELTVSPVKDTSGRVTNFIGVQTDVSDRQRAEEELRRSEELQRQQKESLQHQLIKLVTDIEGASSGDLTVRAEVTAGEIGIVGEFFNFLINSLRQLVTSVKKAASQVNVSVGENEGAIRQLADEALNQAQEITRTLDSVEQMTQSIQEVANSARTAAVVARTASTSAEAGGVAMERTVQSILNLRDTVAETTNKVRRLGESSQQISKVVFLINQIALQTNVLAINASIEAPRAGVEGRGFAVVAEEVGQLAAKSSGATKEIEHIVKTIQLETSEVVKAMELGTAQVIEGTHLVEDTKKSLGQIVDVSHQIDKLVQSISSATVSQAQTSQAVTNLMKELANVSERTSDSSRQVSGSLQQTLEIAQELQASVGTFKVDTE